ncbi:hypothetical protein [Methyloferula stellata]|uniref:hypothetical protein n=1 Tax=Methyloferula stellata TaxID=876270 RepID=UPI000360B478|nr:hypothetical protein [Methyloferula stellata]
MVHKTLGTLLVAFMSFQPMAANAGTCSEEIAKLQKLATATVPRAFVGPTGRQSIGAQLHHQPTPESIAKAQNNAADSVELVLSKAKDLDAAGKEAECMSSLDKAKYLLGLE